MIGVFSTWNQRWLQEQTELVNWNLNRSFELKGTRTRTGKNGEIELEQVPNEGPSPFISRKILIRSGINIQHLTATLILIHWIQDTERGCFLFYFHFWSRRSLRSSSSWSCWSSEFSFKLLILVTWNHVWRIVLGRIMVYRKTALTLAIPKKNTAFKKFWNITNNWYNIIY